MSRMRLSYASKEINKTDFYRQLQELNDKIRIFKTLQEKEQTEDQEKQKEESPKKRKTQSRLLVIFIIYLVITRNNFYMKIYTHFIHLSEIRNSQDCNFAKL